MILLDLLPAWVPSQNDDGVGDALRVYVVAVDPTERDVLSKSALVLTESGSFEWHAFDDVRLDMSELRKRGYLPKIPKAAKPSGKKRA